jgi:hypothetical protein
MVFEFWKRLLNLSGTKLLINLYISLAFTVTWLNESIPSESINLTNYHLLRRDREHKSHAGVCLYVKSSIFIILSTIG